jgi:hypothetical protein
MKWLIFAMLLCIVLAGTTYGAKQEEMNSSACVDCGANSTNETENQTVTHIFLQEGAGGSLINDRSGNYTLTISDVVPYTTFIADRPSRDVGLVPLDKFLKGFDFGVKNPPNAVIILPDENETSDMVAAELTNPQYNNATDALTYNVELLKEYSFKSGWIKDHVSEIDPAIPERFGNVSLVIDGCPCNLVLDTCLSTGCRNSCWDWKAIYCVPCGGCCKCRI